MICYNTIKKTSKIKKTNKTNKSKMTHEEKQQLIIEEQQQLIIDELNHIQSKQHKQKLKVINSLLPFINMLED